MKILPAIAMTGIYGMSIFAQLSPGDLHLAHAELEGLRNCTACHQIGSQDFSVKCLSCHSLLNEQIKAGKGLHGQPGYETCQHCHPDHQGRDFDLVRWPNGRENFDHSQAGFALAGRHTELDCRDCHRRESIADLDTFLSHKKDPTRSFLGLDPRCLGCHEDQHRGQLAEDCGACHDLSGWKPASGFDHGQSQFQLAGKHARTACGECHPTETDPRAAQQATFTRFKPLQFDACLDCHRDEHQGQLSASCTTCHQLEGWQPASNFDHAKTKFPLVGAHRSAACSGCHPSQAGLVRFKGLAATSCGDCHNDIHQGRLSTDCQSCHTPQSWGLLKAGRFDHDQTRFSLRGKHSALDCGACHGSGEKRQIAAFERCSDCHTDEHQGQLDPYIQKDGCESCHNESGFVPASFTLARHEVTAFPLTGAHLAVPCNACHRDVSEDLARAAQTSGGRGSGEGAPGEGAPGEGAPGKKRVRQFKFAGQTCSDCHSDPHGGETDKFMVSPTGSGCETCHQTADWALVTFAHERTKFALEGRHNQTKCRDCHSQPAPDGQDGLTFSGIQTRCETCHADSHRGQFAVNLSGEKVTDCGACHQPVNWLAQKFDHNQGTRFALEGAHLQAPCRACHPTQTDDLGAFLRFKPIDLRCESCHLTPKEPKP